MAWIIARGETCCDDISHRIIRCQHSQSPCDEMSTSCASRRKVRSTELRIQCDVLFEKCG